MNEQKINTGWIVKYSFLISSLFDTFCLLIKCYFKSLWDNVIMKLHHIGIIFQNISAPISQCHESLFSSPLRFTSPPWSLGITVFPTHTCIRIPNSIEFNILYTSIFEQSSNSMEFNILYTSIFEQSSNSFGTLLTDSLTKNIHEMKWQSSL